MADNKINPNSVSIKIAEISGDPNSKRCKTAIVLLFKVKDYPNIFVGSSQISNQLPVTIVGDSIKISFDVDLKK
jgi:hypothetical protein